MTLSPPVLKGDDRSRPTDHHVSALQVGAPAQRWATVQMSRQQSPPTQSSQQTQNRHAPSPQNEARHFLCEISISSAKMKKQQEVVAIKWGRGPGMDGYPASSRRERQPVFS